jgi:hypothetical protein
MNSLSLAPRIGLACLAVCVFATGARAEEPADGLSSRLALAKKKIAAEGYVLAYQFDVGDVVRTKVTHLVTVDTKIKGAVQTAKTRSVSTKSWKITKIDDEGNYVFEHFVDHVDMWQAVTGRQEIRYNSATDETPPPEYVYVAETIGKPLATVVMNRFGQIVDRQDAAKTVSLGMGSLTVPLPTEPAKIGATWHLPEEVKIRLDDGRELKIKVRQQYKLEKVETGVATISVETQVLTPIDDPKVQVQLIQRLQRGTIKFDVDAGRLIHKQMDLSESVIGFNGAESNMQYLARFTEEPTAEVPPAKAEKPQVATVPEAPKVKK